MQQLWIKPLNTSYSSFRVDNRQVFYTRFYFWKLKWFTTDAKPFDVSHPLQAFDSKTKTCCIVASVSPIVVFRDCFKVWSALIEFWLLWYIMKLFSVFAVQPIIQSYLKDILPQVLLVFEVYWNINCNLTEYNLELAELL